MNAVVCLWLPLRSLQEDRHAGSIANTTAGQQKGNFNGQGFHISAVLFFIIEEAMSLLRPLLSHSNPIINECASANPLPSNPPHWNCPVEG